MSKYNADSISIELNDIRRIQGDPSMYIGYVGDNGWKHCIKEGVHNSFDEATNGHGDEIFVDFDEKTQRAVIEDEGRGIPIEKIHDIFTILHSSGKKNKIKTDDDNEVNESYGITAGVHGVGTTVMTALSAVLECTVKRDGHKYYTKYVDGVVTDPVKAVGKTKETGTRIEMVPNNEYLEDVNLKAEDLQEMIWLMSYLLPPGKKVKFHATQLETGMDINHTFQNKEGIKDLLRYKVREYDAGNNTVIYFRDNFKQETTNKDTGETETQVIQELEIAFTFSPKLAEPVRVSFANYCITNEGGHHVDGFEAAVASFFQNEVNKVLTDAEKKKIDKITYADVKQSLVSVVVCNHMKPRFEGQTKEKIINTDITPFVKQATFKFLNEWVKTNQKELTKIISIIKYNAQSRVDGKKSRLLTLKKNIDETFFSDDLPEKFQPAINKKHPHKELYLVEGDSAAGSVVQARFPEFQAINPVKGVPPNSIGMSLTTLMSKPEFAGLVRALKCGIGNSFDIEKLDYEKVIILTDADNDGHKIASLLTVFFLFHLTGSTGHTHHVNSFC